MTAPSIADAKAIASKYGKDGVVILHFDIAKGDFGIASWGADRARCDAMKSIGNQIFDRIASGEIGP